MDAVVIKNLKALQIAMGISCPSSFSLSNAICEDYYYVLFGTPIATHFRSKAKHESSDTIFMAFPFVAA